MKMYLFTCVFCAMLMVTTMPTWAQNAFWTFDEYNNEATIPPQCDGQFDESRGGVFMPTPEELYNQGEVFLMDRGRNRLNAGYCLIAAALQGHVGAQYRLAQLYNKGIVLPQNDLAAYKWAFLASMNGNKDAEQLALMLEQFLSTEDIQLATSSIQSLLPAMIKEKKDALAQQTQSLEEKQMELEKINAEIDAMLGVKFKSDVLPGQKQAKQAAKKGTESSKKEEPVLLSTDGIFSEKDKMK